MRYWLIGAILGLASPAAADVPIVGPNGFVSQHFIDVAVPPDQAYRTFGNVAQWWNPEHTYSGDAKRLRMKLRAGGCFCERLAGGGTVEHMRVAYADPGKRIILNGPLGPLLYQAVVGVMDVRFAKVQRGTMISLEYRVAGFAMNNGDKLAPLVDKVLAEQVRRFDAALRK